MNIENLKKVAVVGGGRMGRQIALNTALHGYVVGITDTIPAVLEDLKNWVVSYLASRVTKGKLTAEKAEEARARFHVEPTLAEAVDGAGLVIEAVLEDKKVKADLFTSLNGLVGEDVVLASNASNLVSSTFKDCVKNPARLANFHYFNPALVMKLVEVVKGEHTSDETVDFLMEFARRTGKTPIRLNKEIDGFVVSRILRVIKDEAFYLVEQGVCSPQDLDLGCVRELELDVSRVNVNGGAIALGHPLGCSGARIVTTLLHEMKKSGTPLGLATICIAGGLGMSMAFEQLEQ